MQTVRGWRGGNQTKVYEDFNPSMDWTHDSSSHILIIDLPGFKREDLKVQIDDIRKLSIYGERQVAGDKYKRFKNIITIPQDSDIAKTSAKFEQGILFITMPKIMAKSTDKQPVLPAVDQEKEAAPNEVEKIEEAPKELDTSDQKKEYDNTKSEKLEKLKNDERDIHHGRQLSKAVDPEKESTPKLIKNTEEAPKEVASDEKKDHDNARSEAMEKMNEVTRGDIDKEPSPLGPKKEAASELVERNANKLKEVAPEQKKEDMTKEAVEEMNKERKVIHDQKGIETQKQEKEGGDEKDQKEEISMSGRKGMKTLGKCRAREEEEYGNFAENMKKKMRIALGWIGEKVKGGMEMEEEGVGRLLDVARKNKDVITAALVGFTIGFYASKKLNR